MAVTRPLVPCGARYIVTCHMHVYISCHGCQIARVCSVASLRTPRRSRYRADVPETTRGPGYEWYSEIELSSLIPYLPVAAWPSSICVRTSPSGTSAQTSVKRSWLTVRRPTSSQSFHALHAWLIALYQCKPRSRCLVQHQAQSTASMACGLACSKASDGKPYGHRLVLQAIAKAPARCSAV